MNQTFKTQQGLIKHGGLHSTTGAHGMRAYNSDKTADHHVRHRIPPPLNHILLTTHKFSSVTGVIETKRIVRYYLVTLRDFRLS